VTTKKENAETALLLPGEVFPQALPDNQPRAFSTLPLTQAFAFDRWRIRISFSREDQFIEHGTRHSRSRASLTGEH
jgi:hypothetical protein